jgi:hypothetical protein
MGLNKLKTNSKRSSVKNSKEQTCDIPWDKVVQTVEKIKDESDRKLEELASKCFNRELNAK